MPFINSFANSVLDASFGKTTSISAKSTVYMALGNVPVDGDKNPVFNTDATALGFVELPNTTDGEKNGYARVMVSRRISSGSSTIVDPAFPHIGAAADRGIQNDYQINWTKAIKDWPRANAIALCTSPDVGETSSIYFVGGLDLTPADKAAGGLLTEAGAVALFDPETFKIEFPAEDVSIA